MNLKFLLLNQHFANGCTNTSFLGFPYWYKYLCSNGASQPALTNISGVWLIVAAVIEILLRVAALAAVGIIIYAGFEYTTSQGNPEKTSRAMNTIISAAVGLVICILSAVIVTFIAESIK